MIEVREAYLDTATSAARLIAEPAVAAAWERPSALPEFGVAALAGHLAHQVLAAPSVLANPLPDVAPIPLYGHYAGVTWRDAGPGDPVNVGIREQGAAHAAAGVQELLTRVHETISTLREALPQEPADRVVFLPWGPWSLTLDDFLVTRMMEIAVHSDDLAASVAIPTPDLPDRALEPVLALLTGLAVRRHGQSAVLRALSRAERAPRAINAI